MDFSFTIPAGAAGVTPTIAAGSTTTGNAGTNASVSASTAGTTTTFNFTIPKGDTGADANIDISSLAPKASPTFTGNITVQGEMYLTNVWFGTYGSQGWYTETQGGGWHMTDSTWLRAVNNKSIYTAGTFYTDGNKSVIRGESPALYLRDTNQRSGMIHMNSNRMYFLSGGTDTESWATLVNGQWPLYLQTDNNNAIFGGRIGVGGGD